MRTALALALLTLPAFAQERKTGEAARVNDVVITWDDVYVKFRGFKPSEITEDLLRAELRKQVEDQLIQQKAKELKITVSEQEIDEAVERVIRAYGGKEKFEQNLRWMKMTFSQHREARRKELLEVKIYRQMIRAGMEGKASLFVEMISPDEVREYYKAHRDRFKSIQQCTVFRIGLQWRTEEEKQFKRRLAESLRRKAQEGSSLDMIAGFYSDVRTTEGGKTSYLVKELKRDNTFFAPETTKYLFETLPEQTVSPVIEDGTTFNLFFLLHRVNQAEVSFEEAQIKIRNELENRKREENRVRLRNELLKKAYVRPEDLFR